MPLPQGAGPKRNPILWFPSVYAYTLCRRSAKFDVTGSFLLDKPRPHPKGAGPQRSPNLGFISIYAYKLCRRTIPTLTWYWEGRVLGSQPRHFAFAQMHRGLSATAEFLFICIG